ncbi:MAG: hypothetical protein WBB37_02570 [bacterium]
MRSSKKTVLSYIKQLRRSIFTTAELTQLSGKSTSTVVQALNHLQEQNIIFKIYRGIWANAADERFNAFAVAPFLVGQHRAYISFISALHLHGIIEQIPRVIMVASTSHTRTIKTSVATYQIHRIHPLFFRGFILDKATRDFLVAEPEKALVDSLYISAHKKKHFGYFPELHFPRSFSIKKTEKWIREIRNSKIRVYVTRKFNKIIDEYRR